MAHDPHWVGSDLCPGVIEESGLFRRRILSGEWSVEEVSGAKIHQCPMCGRVATVAPWVARPVCVHSWTEGMPEIWDGDDVNGEGRKVEDSPNEEYRVPGWHWSEMVEVKLEQPKGVTDGHAYEG